MSALITAISSLPEQPAVVSSRPPDPPPALPSGRPQRLGEASVGIWHPKLMAIKLDGVGPVDDKPSTD